MTPKTRKVAAAVRRNRASVHSFRESLFHAGLGVVLLCLVSGCAIPRGAVLLSTKSPESFGGKFHPIPRQWDGRLLRVGGFVNGTGGSAAHSHAAGHTHALALPASTLEGSVEPVGLDVVVAGPSHRHPVAASQASPARTQEAEYLPRSRELFGLIVRRSLKGTPQGVIVAYRGKKVPEGWARCDGKAGPSLGGLYVCVKRSRVSAEPVGSDTHIHDATHRHVWEVSPPARDYDMGLAVDRASEGIARPNAEAAPYRHVHLAAEKSTAIFTQAAEALPPTVAVNFILCVKDGAAMPAGALIPYTGLFTPPGWKPWRSVSGHGVVGRFVRGAGEGRRAGELFGEKEHSHRMPHSHQLELAPSAAIPVPIRKGPGAKVAERWHRHRVTVDDPDLETGPAPNLPRFLELKFIEKK